MQFRKKRFLQSAATASSKPLPRTAHRLLQLGVTQEQPRSVYLQLLLFTDKCELGVNRGQWRRDALLLLRLSHTQIAVEFPRFSLQPEDAFARFIDFPVDFDEITGQVIANSAQASLFRGISIPACAHRIEVRAEVQDWDTNRHSTDQVMSVSVKIGDIQAGTMQSHRWIKTIIFQPVILLCLIDICELHPQGWMPS